MYQCLKAGDQGQFYEKIILELKKKMVVRVYVNVQILTMAREQFCPSSWMGGMEHINHNLTQEIQRLKLPFALSNLQAF